MARLARLCAAAALAFALAACGGGEGPTQPDIDREAADDGAGLEEDEGPAEY